MRRSGLLRRPGRRRANPPSGFSRLSSTGEGPNRRDGRRKPSRPATVFRVRADCTPLVHPANTNLENGALLSQSMLLARDGMDRRQ